MSQIHNCTINIHQIILMKNHLDLKLWGTLKHFYWA